MGKAERIQSYKDAVAASSDQALSDLCDGIALDQKASDGTLSQADVDAAVQAKADQDAADKAQALAQAKADSDAALAGLQLQLDALALKEGQESGVIAGLQSSLGAMQGAVAALAALVPQA